MRVPMTREELSILPGIEAADKARIEDVIENSIGSDDKEVTAQVLNQALRGFLAETLLAVMVNDNIRAEMGSDAACFVDGWRYCMEFGDPATMFLYKRK